MSTSQHKVLSNPYCHGMHEIPSAVSLREQVLKYASTIEDNLNTQQTQIQSIPLPLLTHLSHGLAYTVGSALGSIPPTAESCLAAYLVPNKAGLTAGARAWSKHAHRSQSLQPEQSEEHQRKRKKASVGWWGTPFGPVVSINEKALALFWKVMGGATWRNLHWLPHQVLVYEMRVPEGYGMRWSQDQSSLEDEENPETRGRPWILRGFVEPTMKNGHELGWRHPVDRDVAGSSLNEPSAFSNQASNIS